MNKNFVLLTGSFLGLLIIDLLTSDYIYQLSNKFAQYIQNNSSDVTEAIMVVFSLFGDVGVISIFIGLFWMFAANKIQTLKLISMIGFVGYLIGVLKMLYKEPRPFFVDKNIETFECPTDFGRPSGHALGCLVFYTLIFDTIVFKKYKVKSDQAATLSFINRDSTDLNQKFTQTQDNEEHYQELYPNATLSLNQCRIILNTFILMIGFSRIYLGSHSINQVILGFIIGAYLLYLYYYKLESLIERLYIKAIYKQFDTQLQLLKFLAYILLFYISSNLFSLSIFILRSYYDHDLITQESQWLKLILIQCPDISEFSNKFEKKLFLDSGTINIPIFLLLAITFCKGSYLPSTFQNHKNCLNLMLRIIFLILTSTPTFIIILIITNFTAIKNYPLVIFILQDQIGLAVFCFSFIVLVPKVYNKLRIDSNGDLLRVEQGVLESNFTKQELEVEL